MTGLVLKTFDRSDTREGGKIWIFDQQFPLGNVFDRQTTNRSNGN